MDDCHVRFSMIVTAQDVLAHCADPAALDGAVRWCGEQGIDKVYLETYRGGTEPKRETLASARRAFERAGIRAAGCICTTGLGEDSGGWPGVPCFSRGNCAERLEAIFRKAAPCFDELIIDNRLFTDCGCPTCAERKGERSWTEFRQDLMVEICERHVIGPALDANPRLRLTFKFPSWFEGIASRGYDVIRHTEMSHNVCAGAETRDPTSDKWGKRQPYGAFFTTHWYHQATGGKCIGSWIDPIACSPEIFMAQVRGSVLGGAREVVLFSMGLFRADEALPDRETLPGKALLGPLQCERAALNRLAALVAEHPPGGVAAYRDPKGDAGGEPYVFEHLGMAGIPLYASPHFPDSAPAAVFAEPSAVPDFPVRISSFLSTGHLALATARLHERVDLAESARLLSLDTSAYFFPDRMRTEETGEEHLAEASCLIESPTDELRQTRAALLDAVNCPVEAPPGVGITLLGDQYVVAQNYRPEPASLSLSGPYRIERSIGPWGLEIIERGEHA